MSLTSVAPSNNGLVPVAARFALVGLVGLSLGILTAYAQGWLPPELGSLANSAGSWALVAFMLAVLLAVGAVSGASIASLALLALLTGYVLGTDARGDSSGSALIVFWSAAALLAGPLIGIGGYWVKGGAGIRPAIGVGAMCGVLVGEGAYGLTAVADTTDAPYWWGEAVAGALLAAWVVARSPHRLRTAAVAGAVGALTAVAFVVVYSQDLMSVLP